MMRIALCLPLICTSIAAAADWPMWRHNTGRTAASPDALPQRLRLQWVRAFPAARPAWPASQKKLQFDASYSPVVMGGRMFVGSTVDDTVRAFSTKDGRELWRFYTDGPVRFAPVAVNARVYAVSDDGHLYCLNAATGKLNWKINGGPSNRPIVGNHRLVSSWPARGGPVYADGVVYFAAGIWPSMGIFIHAVDTKTGRKLWTNSETSSLYVVHPHGAPAFGSVVPQGHLVVNGDALIVPGGRSTPAVLDRKTGKLRFFRFDKRTGHHRVVSAGPYYFVSGNRYGVSKGASAGTAAPDVLTEELAIAGTSKAITAEEIRGKTQRRLKKDRKGRVRISLEFTTKTRWTMTPTDGSPTKVFLTAGKQIYTADRNKIARFAMPAGKSGDSPVAVKQAADWTATVDGDVWTMLAADDRLFVVTVQGHVYCFGEGTRKPQQYALRKRSLPDPAPARALVVTRLMRLAGLSRRSAKTQSDPAFCVVIGADNTDFIGDLTKTANIHTIVVDRNAKSIERLRRNMSAAGVYGSQVCAIPGGEHFPLPPYLAECVIVLDTKSAGVDFSPASLRRLYRPLRPYGGTACLLLSDAEHAAFVKAVGVAKLANSKVTRAAGLTLLKRVGALPRSAGWTHQYGNAANSVVSQDDLVKAPLGVLWFGGPSHDKILPRHGHGPNPQVAGGRLVIEGPDILRAVDVYTGRLLWETQLKGVGKYYDTTRHFAGAGEVGTNYVTLPDAVYVVYGSRLIELDAATGKERRSYSLNAERGKSPPLWGYAAVDGDFLVATSSPVRVAGGDSVGTVADIPKGHRAVIPSGSKWKYLAGKDPTRGWTQLGFNDAKWKTGLAGFGYGDDDDATILKRMRGRYSRVYVRHTFDAKDVGETDRLALLVNYDDAFIAYLNGREIARVGVSSGNGASAKGLRSHEAKTFEVFPIAGFRKLLRPGKNVLSLEGHNAGSKSSDFTLDPLLIAKGTPRVVKTPAKAVPKTPAFEPVRYSSASKRLVVYDRKSGRLLWQREAAFNFRHNCVAVANGKLFCIDGLSPAKLKLLKRRGIDATGKARLYALDLKTGRVLWSADKDVFGTFLNYSAKHDVLLQAGSAYRDRARDEVSRGMVAYRGGDGKVLWKDLDVSYGGPCLLWRDKIITNGGGGYQLELLTGKKTGWSYGRMYGCNTAVGGQHLLTFRSGAAGFCDLTGDSGTGNIGGFRSSCTSNLIAADGVLNAPDYTRSCSCAYQNQTSLALIHMPDNEFWTFNKRPLAESKRIGLNLGAPGDRRSAAGTLWTDAPSIGGPSPDLPVKIEPKDVRWFSRHSSAIQTGPLKWVAASGGTGIRKLSVTLGGKTTNRYTVRLFFAEPDAVKPGERVFSVSLQGKTVDRAFDVVKSAGGSNRSVVREFRNVAAAGTLEIALQPKRGSKFPPVLCGVELIRQDR